MPSMKGKIKNLFSFIGRAWSGGIQGKLGVALTAFAAFMFIGLFWGDVNVQRFSMNVWRLHQERTQLESEQKNLSEIKKHIELLQGYSPDYIEELGLKYLNIGDPKTKILKI
ncbi:MAG: hypothetical protein J6R52_02770 [Alphaproteobacteria bacterium]|nr:hypothetical protein [Alphaproteobacteria bacterium]